MLSYRPLLPLNPQKTRSKLVVVQVRRIQSPVVNARLPARSRLVSGSMSQRGSERVPGE